MVASHKVAKVSAVESIEDSMRIKLSFLSNVIDKRAVGEQNVFPVSNACRACDTPVLVRPSEDCEIWFEYLCVQQTHKENF